MPEAWEANSIKILGRSWQGTWRIPSSLRSLRRSRIWIFQITATVATHWIVSAGKSSKVKPWSCLGGSGSRKNS